MFFHTVGHGGHAVADPKSKKLKKTSGETMEDSGQDFDPDAMTEFRFWFDVCHGDTLPQKSTTVEALDALGEAMVDLSQAQPDKRVDATPNSTIPAVYTYWSQFIDHELTARTDREVENLSEIDGAPGELRVGRRETIEACLKNRRTPGFELDAVYGDGAPHAKRGPSKSMLDLASKLRDGAKMRVGTAGASPGDIPAPAGDLDRDLPRIGTLIAQGVVAETDFPDALRSESNFRSRAFIGDPRNDENLVVAQFHTAMLRFHNAVVDWLVANHAIADETDDQLFERARKICRWTFQWLVVNDFLKTVASPGIVNDVVEAKASHYRELFNKAYAQVMPLEFSVGAYRFGHSMVRNAYDYNANFGRGDQPFLDEATLDLLFKFTGEAKPPFDGRGDGVTLPSNWIIDWNRFVNADPNDADGHPARVARKIDSQIAPPLGRMTKPMAGLMKHLAKRNLRRSYVLNMPTGQAAAKFFGVPAISSADMVRDLDQGLKDALIHGGLVDCTPLWFYVLREAELAGGDRLGALGSKMVAETFVGVMVTDPHSYLAQQPDWHPGQPIPGAGPTMPLAGTSSKIGHLFEFAGVMA